MAMSSSALRSSLSTMYAVPVYLSRQQCYMIPLVVPKVSSYPVHGLASGLLECQGP
jgi:hypothetical protein